MYTCVLPFRQASSRSVARSRCAGVAAAGAAAAEACWACAPAESASTTASPVAKLHMMTFGMVLLLAARIGGRRRRGDIGRGGQRHDRTAAGIPGRHLVLVLLIHIVHIVHVVHVVGAARVRDL